MLKLESTEKYRVESEEDAKAAMDDIRSEAAAHGFDIKKMGYELKQKKKQGEVIDEAYVITVTKIYSPVFDI